MPARVTDIIDTRSVTVKENTDHYAYSLPLAEERDALGTLRIAYVVGNRIVVLFNKRPAPVASFPEPTASTFQPLFK